MFKKNILKRAGALALALALAVVPAVGAYAAENDSTTITINGKGTYGVYRLMDLTVSLKDAGTEHEHTKDCYNYAYTVRDMYRSELQTAVGSIDEGDIDGNGTIDDQEILDYIGGLGNPEAVRTFADKVYEELRNNNVPVEKTITTTENGSGILSDMPQGYYMIVETETADDPDSVSLVILDTKGESALSVNGKEDVPTLTKKIDGGVDATDLGIGDTVVFILDGTMPENITGYETYRYIFHDTIAEGLTIDKDSISVTIDDVTVTPDLVLTYDECSDDCSLEIEFGNILTAADIDADSHVVVTYNATVNSKAVSGAVGNDNVAHLQFSNDPYSTGSTSTTPDDLVRVFTYDVVVNKVDKNGKALAGANFKLQMKNNEGNYVDYREDASVTAETTQFTFSKLDAGEYKLVETQVPNGYNKAADITFEIRATYDGESDNPQLTALAVFQDGKEVSGTEDGSVFRISLDAGQVSTSVVNTSGILLPETGGAGRYVVYGASAAAAVLMAGVIVMAVKRKKKTA